MIGHAARAYAGEPATVAGPGAVVGPATANETSNVSAEATFARGLASYEAKRWGEAVETWEALVAGLGEERGFKVLYNLGLAYEAGGDATRAIESFEGFLRHLAAQPAALSRELEERRQDAAERARAMKATRGAVLVPATPGHRNAVRVDGAAARAAGFTAYLLPGEHAFEVFSGSPAARTVRVKVAAGERRSIDTAPPAAPVLAPRVVVMAAPEAPPAFPTAWVAGGGALAAASLALPVALGLRAAEARGEALALGRGHSQYADAGRRFEDARGVYLASFGVPAALAAATLVVATVSLVRVRTYRAEKGAAAGGGGGNGGGRGGGGKGAGDAGRAVLSIRPGGVWLTGQF